MSELNIINATGTAPGKVIEATLKAISETLAMKGYCYPNPIEYSYEIKITEMKPDAPVTPPV